MLENGNEEGNSIPIIHREYQQIIQVNEKTENFHIKNEMEESSISYEPELISKDEISIKPEITYQY